MFLHRGLFCCAKRDSGKGLMEEIRHHVWKFFNPMAEPSRRAILIVRKLMLLWMIVLFIISNSAVTAFAQVPSELVPGRQNSGGAVVAPEVTPPPVLPDEPRLQKAPQNSNEITLVLNGITMTGAETIKPAKLSKLWARYIGEEISVATLYEIANQITRTYVDAGYALSFAFVPEQEIGEDGMVVIRVVEGFVDDILFTGDLVRKDRAWVDGTSPLPKTAGEYARKIMESRPLKSKDMERYLLLINDQPGITARAVFTASETTQNASRMVVEIARTPVEATASVENHLSPTLEYWSFGGTATVNGFFTGSDSVSVTARCGIMCDSYKYFGLSWSNYFGDDGIRMKVDVTHSNIAPGKGPLALLDFEGIDSSMSLDLSYPLLRRRSENIYLGAELLWSEGETETFAGTLTQDSIRSASAYISYDVADPTGAVTSLRSSISQGIPIFGATEDDDTLRSRVGGSAEFTTLDFNVLRNQPLGPLGSSFGDFSILATANGQMALGNPLLSASQCYYGGSSMGRGYNSGSLGGDNCLMGSAELRYDWPWENVLFQTYGFGDFGAVWRKGNSLPAGEEKTASAKSIGGGLRMNLDNTFRGDFMVAMPLDKEVTSNGKATPKFLFSMSVQY